MVKGKAKAEARSNTPLALGRSLTVLKGIPEGSSDLTTWI
jgi:hypothetical protein